MLFLLSEVIPWFSDVSLFESSSSTIGAVATVVEVDFVFKNKNPPQIHVVASSVDIILIFFSYYLAFIVRFYQHDKLAEITSIFINHSTKITFFAAIYVLIFYCFKQYNSIWTLAGYREFINGVIASISAMVINIIISLFVSSRVPIMVSIIAGIMVMITCCGVRIYWRVLRRALKFTEIKNKEDITEFVPENVEKYIKKNKLYEGLAYGK